MTAPARTARAARAQRLTEALDDLLGPPLPARPACAGRAPLHDAAVHGENPEQHVRRLLDAIDTCRSCPALTACRRLVDDLPTGSSGIYAGRLIGPAATQLGSKALARIAAASGHTHGPRPTHEPPTLGAGPSVATRGGAARPEHTHEPALFGHTHERHLIDELGGGRG